MAELQLKIKSVNPDDPRTYQRGDVVMAFNSRRIRCAHAMHICHPVQAGGGIGQHRDTNHVSFDFYNSTHQYRNDRITRTEIRRTNLITSAEDIITGPEFIVTIVGFTSDEFVPFLDMEEVYNERVKQRNPVRPSVAALIAVGRRFGTVTWDEGTEKLFINGVEAVYSVGAAKKEFTWVEDYIKRRLNHGQHSIFGATGSEIWFRGRQDYSHAALDKVWAAIESKTPLREVDFSRWPAGTIQNGRSGSDLSTFLFVTVGDFNDTIAQALVASEYDLTDPENPILVQKRLNMVDWPSLVDSTQLTDIEDPTIDVDLRDTLQLTILSAVQEKTRLA